MRAFTTINLILLFASLRAFAGEHPAGGTLKITRYSHSILQDKTVCEGSHADRTLSGGKSFDSVAVPMGEPPKSVALQAKHHAQGCTLVFKSGPWAGKSVPVGDTNGHDTIDVPIDTHEAKDKKACQKILNGGKDESVEYALTDCPGNRGTRPASSRARGTKARLK